MRVMTMDNEPTSRYRKEPRLGIWTLMWAGFWTGVLSCGYVLLMH